jgi:hypothetical protein
MRKKLFVLFILAAVVSSFGLAGLNVLPHTHGEDIDHSQHADCPVHQASLLHGDSEPISAVILSVYFLIAIFLGLNQRSHSSQTTSYTSSRAPPVLA